MISVGIVGAGPGATLHVETVRMAAGMELAGIAAGSTGSPRAAALAEGLGCPVLTLPELGRASDLAIVATPPAARPVAAARLAESRRLRAVLVESPAGTTIDAVESLRETLAPRPVMLGANLLHAPAVRRLLEAIAAMEPHHLELRMAVPDPNRGAGAGRSFGGGVMMDPGAGFWPVLMAALSSEVVAVSAPSMHLQHSHDRAPHDHTPHDRAPLRNLDSGSDWLRAPQDHAMIDHTAEVVLRSADGRRARARIGWGASIAEASLEAADAAHVARVEFWPKPLLEIDGSAVSTPGRRGWRSRPDGRILEIDGSAVSTHSQKDHSLPVRGGPAPAHRRDESALSQAEHPLTSLGFLAQLQRLDRVGRGESKPWPDLGAGAAALTVVVCAAMSARRGGEEVSVQQAPRDASPFAVLNKPTR